MMFTLQEPSPPAEIPADKAEPGEEDDTGRKEIRAGLIAIFAFFVGFGGWAAITPLDAGVVAHGLVVVSGNRQAVQHRDGGVIGSLNVNEGDRVERGQVLIELSAPEVVAQEQALLSQVLDLQMQRQRLNAEQRGARVLERPPEWAALTAEDRAVAELAFERHRREASRSAWSEFDARINGYRGEIAALDRQEVLLREELVGMRELANEQLVPITRVRGLERSLAELQGRRSDLVAQIAATQQERSEALRTVEARLSELLPQLAGARQRLELTRLRAPVSGRIVGLSAHTVGGVIGPGERVLEIVPEDNELVVEAQVRPEDADSLEPGQSTEVKITAFSGRNLPIVHGEIRRVSADRLVDQHTGDAYFIVQVVVPPRELDRLTEASGRELRAGFPAQIVVPTRERTALQYLLEPLNQTFWRAFREE